MRRRVRDQRREQGGVEHQHGAGDAGHAAGHHQEQFAAGELRQIGADEQRRLDHAEKDIGGGRQPHRAADAERALQQPRHAAHDRRQHAPVEQQRRQHAHDQHDRQRLKRQDEIRARRLEIERQRAAAEIAEHEGGAGARGRRDRVDGVVDGAERLRHRRQLEQHQRGDDGDGKADRRLPQRDRAAVFAKRPCDRQQRQHAERRLQLQHESPATPGAIMPARRGERNAVLRALSVDNLHRRSATGSCPCPQRCRSAPAICSGTGRSCSSCCREAFRASPARSRRSRSAGRSTTSPAAPSSSAWSGWCNSCPRRCWFSSPAMPPTASSASAWCSFASSRKRRRRCFWPSAPLPAGSPWRRSSSPPS